MERQVIWNNGGILPSRLDSGGPRWLRLEQPFPNVFEGIIMRTVWEGTLCMERNRAGKYGFVRSPFPDDTCGVRTAALPLSSQQPEGWLPSEFSPNFLCICFIRDSLSLEFKNVHQPECWFVRVYWETQLQSDMDTSGPWPAYVLSVGIQLAEAGWGRWGGGGEGGLGMGVEPVALSSEDSLCAQSRREIPDSMTLSVWFEAKHPWVDSADWPWLPIIPSGSFQSSSTSLALESIPQIPQSRRGPASSRAALSSLQSMLWWRITSPGSPDVDLWAFLYHGEHTSGSVQ